MGGASGLPSLLGSQNQRRLSRSGSWGLERGAVGLGALCELGVGSVGSERRQDRRGFSLPQDAEQLRGQHPHAGHLLPASAPGLPRGCQGKGRPSCSPGPGTGAHDPRSADAVGLSHRAGLTRQRRRRRFLHSPSCSRPPAPGWGQSSGARGAKSSGGPRRSPNARLAITASSAGCGKGRLRCPPPGPLPPPVPTWELRPARFPSAAKTLPRSCLGAGPAPLLLWLGQDGTAPRAGRATRCGPSLCEASEQQKARNWKSGP